MLITLDIDNKLMKETSILPLKFKMISDKVGQTNATKQVKLIRWKYTYIYI